MARDLVVDWQAVRDDDYRVPPGSSLTELTTELTVMLGDPDPRRRDTLALTTLLTWVERGVYDDLLPGLGDGMAAGLRAGLADRRPRVAWAGDAAEAQDDSVFRRSCSALVLAECVARDARHPLVPGAKVIEWADRIASWLLDERDLRGYVVGKGWAHAVAHGADAIGILARSPHFATPELTVLLDVVGERVVAPAARLFTHGEPDRLALATIELLRRDRIAFTAVESWLAGLLGPPSDPNRAVRRAEPGHDPSLDTGNLEAFLRSLYLQLALGPRPPRARADLMLVLIEAMRTLAPVFLGTAAESVTR